MPTPFELRLEVLKMARDLLQDDYYQRKEQLLEQWRTECDSAVRSGENNPKMPAMPSFPTDDQILQKAEILNKFITTVK